MKNAVASNWVAETCVAEGSGFTLKGTSKGYTSFSDAFSAGDQVFYSAHDSQGNREAGYATFDGVGLVDREPTATLVNGVYNKSPALSFKFDGEITIACTFNAVAFNVLWKALDAIDPDGDGNINIPPELIDGLIEKLDTKAEQADLEQEIKDRIDGDKALQDQIDALDPDGDRKVDWSEIEGKPSEFPPEAHNQDWGTITGKPADYPPSAHNHAWDQITGKPAEFPPADHNHDGEYLKTETDPTVPDHVKAITTDDIDNWNASSGAASTWDELTGKPTEFPPEAHTQDWSTITNTPSEYPPEDHTHAQSEVDGLELRLEAIEDSITSGGGFVDAPNDGQLYGRQSEAWAVIPTGGASSWDDLADKPAEFPPEAHQHGWDQITGKPSDYPPSAHNHDGVYAPVDHTHEIADVDGLQEALDAAGESLWTQNGDDIYYDAGNVIHKGILKHQDRGTGSGELRTFHEDDVSYIYSIGSSSAGTIKFNRSMGGTATTSMTIAANGDVSTSENLRIQNKTGGVGAKSELTFVNSDILTGESGRANIVVERVDSGSGGYDSSIMTFSTTIGGVTADFSPRMQIDAQGRVGIGGEPSRSTKDIEEEAEATLRNWNSKDKKPTKAELIKKLAERNIGGGDAKLQVSGDGYFSGIGIGGTTVRRQDISGIHFGGGSLRPVGTSNTTEDAVLDLGATAFRFKDGYFSNSVKVTGGDIAARNNNITVNSDTVAGYLAVGGTELYSWNATDFRGQQDAIFNLGDPAARWKDGHFSGLVHAAGLVRTLSGMGGVTFNSHNDGPETLPTDTNGIRTDGQMNLGRRSAYRYKNAFLTGDVYAANFYGKVADVPDHVKAITPTQIANWDAGTGGGGGGATTDGRISDTQIIHWDQAYSWGNHANAGYQPAGSYATTSDLSNYVPKSGNTTISGTLTATDFVASSDERLKDNISPMPVGLIDDIKPVQWTWKDSGKKSAGVIAQQLQEIGLGDFVTEGEDGMLGVNYNALVSVLLAEVISLKKELAK